MARLGKFEYRDSSMNARNSIAETLRNTGLAIGRVRAGEAIYR
jgi:hypothetical protein